MSKSKHMKKSRVNKIKLLHYIKITLKYSFKVIELLKLISEMFH